MATPGNLPGLEEQWSSDAAEGNDDLIMVTFQHVPSGSTAQGQG